VRENVTASFEAMVAELPTRGVILPVHKVLTERAKELLWEITRINSSPLCITIALEMILSLGSFEDLTVVGDKMKAALAMDQVPGLISLIFADLEENHGKKFVAALLGLLTLAVEGLSEREAEDILSTMDDVLDFIFVWWVPPIRRLPPMLVRRVIADLGKYLIQRRSESGILVYNWYHRQFWETARKRYLSDATVRERLHGVLASYFANIIPVTLEHGNRHISSQPLVLNNTSVWSDNCVVNQRRIVEGCYHLLHAGSDFFNDAINELCDFDTICASIIAGDCHAALFNTLIFVSFVLCMSCIFITACVCSISSL
jgi:hypothetical protein